MQRMSLFRQQTHYELLGLSFLASQEDIRVAYKRLALLWHPDRNPHCDRRVAQDKFQAIQQAYSVLSRPDRRQAYHLECLDCWDMKEYLSNFRDLVLTPSGLGLQPYSAERMLAGIRHPVPLLLAA
ncbi:TPA: hypothetical protein ACH3X2_005509 [Trebouxia sp. C0005]